MSLEMAYNLPVMEFVLNLLAGCDTYPQQWHEPLYVPILFSMVAAGIFAAGKAAQIREGRPKPFRWAALLPLAIALYSGISTVSCLRDSFYRALMSDWGKKGAFGHYGAIAVPVMVLGGMLLWEWINKRNEFRE